MPMQCTPIILLNFLHYNNYYCIGTCIIYNNNNIVGTMIIMYWRSSVLSALVSDNDTLEVKAQPYLYLVLLFFMKKVLVLGKLYFLLSGDATWKPFSYYYTCSIIIHWMCLEIAYHLSFCQTWKWWLSHQRYLLDEFDSWQIFPIVHSLPGVLSIQLSSW